MRTVYAAIGNSDDKLSQREWAEYYSEFVMTVTYYSMQVHGEWLSAPQTPHQNACMCVVVYDEKSVDKLRGELIALRKKYRQDAVAFAVVDEVEFV